jgi:septal ring factor EnvC (AmiA/AmiB activator)
MRPESVAKSYPQLDWLAPKTAPNAPNAPDISALAVPGAPSPDQQQLNAISFDLEAVRQSVERIAASQEQITRNVDGIAASIASSQEQITHSVDRIAASQEQMTRGITKLQEIEQYILYKNSDSPPQQPAAAPARSRASRPSQAPTTPTPAGNP